MADSQEGAETYQRAPDAVWRLLPGTLLVAHPCGESCLVIEGSVASLWHALQQPQRLGDLCAYLAETHGVESRVVEAGLTPTLQRLVEAGLVLRWPS